MIPLNAGLVCGLTCADRRWFSRTLAEKLACWFSNRDSTTIGDIYSSRPVRARAFKVWARPTVWRGGRSGPRRNGAGPAKENNKVRVLRINAGAASVFTAFTDGNINASSSSSYVRVQGAKNRPTSSDRYCSARGTLDRERAKKTKKTTSTRGAFRVVTKRPCAYTKCAYGS